MSRNIPRELKSGVFDMTAVERQRRTRPLKYPKDADVRSLVDTLMANGASEYAAIHEALVQIDPSPSVDTEMAYQRIYEQRRTANSDNSF